MAGTLEGEPIDAGVQDGDDMTQTGVDAGQVAGTEATDTEVAALDKLRADGPQKGQRVINDTRNGLVFRQEYKVIGVQGDVVYMREENEGSPYLHTVSLSQLQPADVRHPNSLAPEMYGWVIQEGIEVGWVPPEDFTERIKALMAEV